MNLRQHSNGKRITLDPANPIGKGGEGNILPVIGDARQVAKIFHALSPEREHKLRVMLSNPPNAPTRRQGHASITWPTDLLRNDAGAGAGYLMPRVHDMLPVAEFYNPAKRRKHCATFNYRYLHTAAANIAYAVSALHDRGYVIGDVNESNALVSVTALATLVDTDSFQVRDGASGTVYRCVVGKPPFTPAEMQSRDLTQVVRSAEQDRFGLGC